MQVAVASGPYFVGQGFELRVGVAAGGERPRIEPPRVADARVWAIGTELRPIQSTDIGSVVAEENRYVFRFRVMAQRAGTLTIPAIPVHAQGRSGRSQPKRLVIQSVPLQGRPAEFLGGVGRFDLNAEATPNAVRVGQELDYRIRVTGPAAWGMTDRPELGRFGRLGLELSVEPRPDETSDEPPARTFVFRLRPLQAGESVLPPVAIAAFDQALSRYVTHVTPSVPIRVVAVAPFDPTSVRYDSPATAASWPGSTIGIMTLLGALMLLAYTLLLSVRRRLRQRARFGPEQARRFARRAVRYLGSVPVETRLRMTGTMPTESSRDNVEESQRGIASKSNKYNNILVSIWGSGPPEVLGPAARRIAEQMSTYLRLGTGLAVVALTPAEARDGVANVTQSEELASQAGQLTERCDTILYGDSSRGPPESARMLIDDARGLFEALGRVEVVHRDSD
jgi:hypothetical protein